MSDILSLAMSFWYLIVIILIAVWFSLKGLLLVGDDEVGIITRRMGGEPMPQGHIIARNRKQVGIQADTLQPGLYWFMPFVWIAKKNSITVIKKDQVGYVSSIDGKPLQKDRTFGDAVECNNFQDAAMFLENGGYRGPQIAILPPGEYRINTEIFRIEVEDATTIESKQIGIVIAQDGIPLPSGYMIAPEGDPNINHKRFQDAQAFIDGGGYRGPQLETLQAGLYYINTKVFNIKVENIKEVPPGFVAVIRSNVGQEISRSTKTPALQGEGTTLNSPLNDQEVVLTNNKFERGILDKAVTPGEYNLNPLAYTPYFVPTSAITVDWAAAEALRTEKRMSNSQDLPTEEVDSLSAKAFFRFSTLKVTSQDGFTLKADVRMVVRVKPENGPFIIARFGSIENLVHQIIHPLIDSSFRNKAGEMKALVFVKERIRLQEESLKHAKEAFAPYHVEAQTLLLSYIDVDAELLKTQTDKELALQQQEQYEEQAAAQKKRIEVEKQKAEAEKQADVVKAKLSIDIARDEATAARESAYGDRDSTKARADGKAYEAKEIGLSEAAAMQAKVEAIGKEALTSIKIIEAIGANKINITPHILVNGGSGNGENTLLNGVLTGILASQFPETKKLLPATEEKKQKSQKKKDDPTDLSGLPGLIDSVTK